MITAHAGFSANPINNPNPTITEGLIDLPQSGVSIYADAVDSSDPAAVFTFAWSVLNPRTGQTAAINTQQANTTLDNIAAVWGDVRLFVITTNVSTGEQSETDPREAPASAFCTLKIESEARALTLPAIGSREWWLSFDNLSDVVERLTAENTLTGASINGSGELILTLSDGSTINAGTIPTGTDTRRVIYSTGPLFGYFDGQNHHDGINPAKRVWIAGPWVAHTALEISLASITLYDGGPLNNQITFELALESASNWAQGSSGTPPAGVANFSVTQNLDATPLTATSSPLSITATTGTLFGLVMDAPTGGKVDGLNVNITATEL